MKQRNSQASLILEELAFHLENQRKKKERLFKNTKFTLHQKNLLELKIFGES